MSDDQRQPQVPRPVAPTPADVAGGSDADAQARAASAEALARLQAAVEVLDDDERDDVTPVIESAHEAHDALRAELERARV